MQNLSKTVTVILLLMFVFVFPKSAFSFTKKVNGIKSSDSIINPLIKFSTQWSDSKYEDCNTAKNNNYLNKEEKKVIWTINMIRFNPQLFLNTVLLNPKCDYYEKPEKRNSYYKSLIQTLKLMKPIKLELLPDSLAFVSARCHAYHSGIIGYVGHERNSNECKKDFNAECCDYGNSGAVNILMNLLIDDGIVTLGHRNVCLSNQYTSLGISIQPHHTYEYNAVLDFK